MSTTTSSRVTLPFFCIWDVKGEVPNRHVLRTAVVCTNNKKGGPNLNSSHPPPHILGKSGTIEK